jgi:predicted ArsR family transcriptional regulator
MPVWIPRFNATRGRLVALLRRRPRTVDELAAELGVTDNAVRAQLIALERDGVVRAEGFRRGGGNKPATSYSLTPEFEPALSRAYLPLLVQLLRELDDRMSDAELRELMAAVGHRWAGELPRLSGDARARAAGAAAFLSELGGIVEVDEADGAIALRGVSCPLGVAVRERPQLCAALEKLLGDALGAPVRERCNRTGDRPRCCFELVRQP